MSQYAQDNLVRVAASRLAVAMRTCNGGGGGDPEAVAAARRVLAAAKVEREIRRALDGPDPLTGEQRFALAGILVGGGSK